MIRTMDRTHLLSFLICHRPNVFRHREVDLDIAELKKLRVSLLRRTASIGIVDESIRFPKIVYARESIGSLWYSQALVRASLPLRTGSKLQSVTLTAVTRGNTLTV